MYSARATCGAGRETQQGPEEKTRGSGSEHSAHALYITPLLARPACLSVLSHRLIRPPPPLPPPFALSKGAEATLSVGCDSEGIQGRFRAPPRPPPEARRALAPRHAPPRHAPRGTADFGRKRGTEWGGGVSCVQGSRREKEPGRPARQEASSLSPRKATQKNTQAPPPIPQA